MNISKLDAAKRQLDSAITFYFRDGDPVSMHTLTAAAHEILMVLGKQENVESIIKGHGLKIIKEEYHKEYLDTINKAGNFFKHGSKDSNQLLDFNPETTEIFLFDAIEMYFRLTKELPEDMSIFRVWFTINNPYILTEEFKKQLNQINYKVSNKQKFYSDIKSALILNKI